MKNILLVQRQVAQRRFWNRPFAILLAMLAFFVPHESRTLAASEVAASNHPPRLVVAVLPFENASGDAALDAWRRALPTLVGSCLALIESVSVPGWKKIGPSLTRAGWTDAKAIDPELARQAARELKAGFAVWGNFQRETNGWVVEAKVLRADSNAPPDNIRLVAPNPVKLAESLAVHLAAQWDRRFADDEMERWRMSVTHDDAAAAKLARALALELREASAAEQEQAWRAVLDADPRCGMAYPALRHLLVGTGQDAEINRLVQQHVRLEPRSCEAHAANGFRLLVEKDGAGAEVELREALRLHPSCFIAVRALFKRLGNSDRWADLVPILKLAHADQPRADFFRILLASALAQTGDLDGAHVLLDAITDLPVEDDMVDKALLLAALRANKFELAGRELLRLGPQTATNKQLREDLGAATLVFYKVRDGRTNPTVVRPRSYTAAELDAELERILTLDERALVENPIALTPELTAEARRLTVGFTNRGLQTIALFAEVARRGRGTGDGGQRTASEALQDSGKPEARFACQEHAKLFVALARALGLDAWLVHVELCADGSPAYHDCAAIFLDGQGLLVDPTWRVFGIWHKDFATLDDLQAISHQAMQIGPKADPRRLRLGLKLNPDDRWTRLQFVRGMARAGELAAAEEELRKVQSTGADTWDLHAAAADLEIARERWQPALAELQRAVALSPSNALVHVRMSDVYDQLRDSANSDRHMKLALQLDRGELSGDFRRDTELGFRVNNALSQAKSGAPGSLEALRHRAEAGDFAAQMALAKACFEAQPARTDEGMRWLQQAAGQGYDQAQYLLAMHLLVLRGEKDAPAAVQWLNKSAVQSNDDAQYQLGLILYEGKLAPRDNVTAAKWVYLAADQKHVEARRLLREMQLFLTAAEMTEARVQADAFKPTRKPLAVPQK